MMEKKIKEEKKWERKEKECSDSHPHAAHLWGVQPPRVILCLDVPHRHLTDHLLKILKLSYDTFAIMTELEILHIEKKKAVLAYPGLPAGEGNQQTLQLPWKLQTTWQPGDAHQ